MAAELTPTHITNHYFRQLISLCRKIEDVSGYWKPEKIQDRAKKNLYKLENFLLENAPQKSLSMQTKIHEGLEMSLDIIGYLYKCSGDNEELIYAVKGLLEALINSCFTPDERKISFTCELLAALQKYAHEHTPFLKKFSDRQQAIITTAVRDLLSKELSSEMLMAVSQNIYLELVEETKTLVTLSRSPMLMRY
jgi:hypothetical protein